MTPRARSSTRLRGGADAGAASFRRQASLQQHLAEAEELGRDIKQREERIRAALQQLPQVQAVKQRNGEQPEHARVSTTDAHARVMMKMGDGSFRPAFNVQLASTCEEQVIERTGCTPGQWLVDGGFPAHEQIDAVHAHTQGNTQVIAPVPEPRRKRGDDDTPPVDKHQRKEGDSEAVAQWRSRMAGGEIKGLYRAFCGAFRQHHACASTALRRMPDFVFLGTDTLRAEACGMRDVQPTGFFA